MYYFAILTALISSLIALQFPRIASMAVLGPILLLLIAPAVYWFGIEGHGCFGPATEAGKFCDLDREGLFTIFRWLPDLTILSIIHVIAAVGMITLGRFTNRMINRI